MGYLRRNSPSGHLWQLFSTTALIARRRVDVQNLYAWVTIISHTRRINANLATGYLRRDRSAFKIACEPDAWVLAMDNRTSCRFLPEVFWCPARVKTSAKAIR